MDNNPFLELSDDRSPIISIPPTLPSIRSFLILPHKRKDRKESCGYPISRFNSPPPRDFLCILCSNVVKKPVECKKCGKLYCENCSNMLKKIDDTNGTKTFICTICNCVQEPKQPSIVLIRMISELKMKCNNYDLGCLNYITIEDMNKHELICPFREVLCENHRNCKKSGLIKDFIETEGVFRSAYSHLSHRLNGRHKSYTCSENCRKIVLFEKMVHEKQFNKALLEYYTELTHTINE
jgi:hypothetical protein